MTISQTGKTIQNRNRPIDIKNKLMVAKGEQGGDMGIKNKFINDSKEA